MIASAIVQAPLVASDVRVALGGELFDGGVKWVRRNQSELPLTVTRVERSVGGLGDAIKLIEDRNRRSKC